MKVKGFDQNIYTTIYCNCAYTAPDKKGFHCSYIMLTTYLHLSGPPHLHEVT